MSESTRNMLREQLESTRDDLADLWRRIDALDTNPDDPEGDPIEELSERPLEIVWEKGTPFSVLLTFGGPNVWIECDSRDVTPDYVLKGAWGGERDEIRGESITRTGEYFRELVEEG